MSVYVDVLRYRDLFGSLFRREFQVRYKGSVLGVAWSLANPLLLLAVYLLVFSLLWRVTGTIEHYPLYLITARGLGVLLDHAPGSDAEPARALHPAPEDAVSAPAGAALGRRDPGRDVR